VLRITVTRLFFEDLEVGYERACGSFGVDENDIVEFASQYDPQPYHLDSEAAAESAFGELVASGWMTLCLSTRLVVDAFRKRVATMGGLGIDDLRWTEPVRPGDTLSVRTEVVDKRISESDPSRGIMRERVTVDNQADDRVLTYLVASLVERRADAQHPDDERPGES
jgi:acyl dehydratase